VPVGSSTLEASVVADICSSLLDIDSRKLLAHAF